MNKKVLLPKPESTDSTGAIENNANPSKINKAGANIGTNSDAHKIRAATTIPMKLASSEPIPGVRRFNRHVVSTGTTIAVIIQ